jgi:hypothetical protein
MYPKITGIKADDDYILIIKFDNGMQKRYDFKRNLKRSIFQALNDKFLFKQVKIDPGGYGISWNDDLDLSEYELWENGVICPG